MQRVEILGIAHYCSDNECPMNVSMKDGAQKSGTALHVLKDEFLIIRTTGQNDLINISEVDKVECALGKFPGKAGK